MNIGGYIYGIAKGVDRTFNALTAGSVDETFSARCYEAAVVKSYTFWQIPYQLVNGGAYAVRWTIGRLLGYRFGVDMPSNHCEDAFLYPFAYRPHTYDD